jgi:hypothetical protein
MFLYYRVQNKSYSEFRLFLNFIRKHFYEFCKSIYLAYLNCCNKYMLITFIYFVKKAMENSSVLKVDGACFRDNTQEFRNNSCIAKIQIEI